MPTELTKAQKERMQEYVRKWTEIGLCTDPADRPRAEAGIRLAYQAVGLPVPERIIWCGSPISGALARALIGEPSLKDRMSLTVS